MHLECFQAIFRNHEIRLRDDVSAHQNDGSEAFSLCWRTMLHHINIKSINIWCEALSSRWPVDARLPKCPSVTFPFFMPDFGMFSGIIISSYGLSHQSLTLGNQYNMSGVRGSYWDGLDRKIILEKMENADFNLMKCWILNHIRINIGAFQASSGIIRDHQE